MEFSNDRLKAAPNAIGQKALLTRLLGDNPAQIVIGTVSFQDVVPQGPDVTVTNNNFGNVKKKFNIVRYEIQGAPSEDTEVTSVLSISANHKQQLMKFQAHLLQAGNMDTEYDYLVNVLQPDTLSYLTATGITMAGNSVGGTASNMLITEFSPSVSYEELLDADGDTYRIFRSFTMVIENRRDHKYGFCGLI